MDIYIPYFYIIQDIRNGMYYAGSKYGKNANPKTFMKEGGYYTTSKEIKRIIKEYGLCVFKIRKVKIFKTKEETHNYETKFLRKVNARNNSKFYNKHNNNWSICDNENRVTVKNKNGVTFQVSIFDEKYILINNVFIIEKYLINFSNAKFANLCFI